MPFNNTTNNLFREQKVVNSAVNYVVLADDVIINITNTAVPRTVTLPAPGSMNVGKAFFIKDTSGGAGTNNITATPASGTIDGAASYVINQDYGSATFYSDGTNYFIQTRSKKNTSTLASFKAIKNSIQTIPTSTVTTIVSYTSTVFDTTSSFNATTGIFTAPRAAHYLLIGGIMYNDVPNVDDTFRVFFDVNNSGTQTESGIMVFPVNAGAATLPVAQVSTIFNLTANDEVRMRTFQDTGANANIQVTPSFNYFQAQELV